jgi:tetratricopeptide (TPR) repeat protein
MTLTPLSDLQDAKLDPQLEYRALVRSLKYTHGFGLLFVQCSPAEGERLITKVRQDLPQKHIEVLTLTEPIETLYDKVDNIHRNKPIDVLFVQGIEHSLYDYEKQRLWDDEAQRLSYSETGVPRLLQHLNLSRERFQETFAFHFVFLVPHFTLKYLIRRAPDFFDWNSGVLEFPMGRQALIQRMVDLIVGSEPLEQDSDLTLPQDKFLTRLLEIQALIDEPYQVPENKAVLLREQARLYLMQAEWEEATISYRKMLEIIPIDADAWNNQGFALDKLERYEEALTSYDKALQLRPNYDLALNNRSTTLGKLERYEEALTSYDKVLQFTPDADFVWYKRASILNYLGRDEEAIISYDKSLQLAPSHNKAWSDRGSALVKLGRYEEAIASYDKALQLNPDDDLAFYNKACCYALQNSLENSISNLSHAIALNPGKNRDMAKTDSDFDSIRHDKRFQALINGI